MKPEFWRDEITGLMEPGIALFYLGISGYADDEGRFEWSPALIRADLDPYDAKWGGMKGIERRLEDLLRLKRVRRYTVRGRTYGVIPTHCRHQKPNRPTPSRFPEPPEEDAETLTEDSLSAHGALTAGEGVGDGEGEEARSAAASVQSVSPVVALLSCVGAGPSEYGVTEAEIEALSRAYPSVNVAIEVERAALWLQNNPAKRKTHRGMPRFLQNWMARQQDRGGTAGATPQADEPEQRRWL